MGDDANRLGIMVEATETFHHLVQPILARMAKGRVAKVMRQRQRFRQVLVQIEAASQPARQLRHFERMGQPCAVMVALMVDEHLRFIFEPPKRDGMNDAVAVALVRGAHAAFGLGHQTPARELGVTGIGGEALGCGGSLHARNVTHGFCERKWLGWGRLSLRERLRGLAAVVRVAIQFAVNVSNRPHPDS